MTDYQKNSNRRNTPEGMRDILSREASVRQQCLSELVALFSCRGYVQVVTPGLEFLDMFQTDTPALNINTMYKLVDSRGRLLAIRPDSTLPIARMAATRLQQQPLPLRLFYSQQVYEVCPSLSGRDHETLQAGVELIGAAGGRADLDILTLAAEATRRCVGDEFHFEVGHAGIFHALLEGLSAEDAVKNRLCELIENKNFAGLGELCATLPDSAEARALQRLPRLFGGSEILCEARQLCCVPEVRYADRIREALDALEQLYATLTELGLAHQMMLDLGLVHRNSYYTGMVFRGYVEGSGDTVVSGGRYDTLLREFGADLPATGFAVNVDAITRVRMAAGDGGAVAAPEVLVYAGTGAEAAAIRQVQQLTAEGTVCEFSVFEDRAQAQEYACKKGIERVTTVADNGEVTAL